MFKELQTKAPIKPTPMLQGVTTPTPASTKFKSPRAHNPIQLHAWWQTTDLARQGKTFDV